MLKILLVLYKDFRSAENAVRDLIQNEFAPETTGLITPDLSPETGQEGQKPGYAPVRITVFEHAVSLKVPGIGPVFTAGTMATSLVGEGLPEILVDRGVPRDRAELFAEGVRRGGTLVTIETEDPRMEPALDIVRAYRPIDIDLWVKEWRAEGWTRFDPLAEPLPRLLWPREAYREPEDRLPIVERNLYPRDLYRPYDELTLARLLWPRDAYRAPGETSGHTVERRLWPRDIYRIPEEGSKIDQRRDL